MKSKEELSALKAEVEVLNHELSELTDDELQEVTGGMKIVIADQPSFLQPILRFLFKIKD